MGFAVGPCRFLGEATGELELCETCTGKTSAKVFACSHPAHDKTTHKKCRTCRDCSPAPLPVPPVTPDTFAGKRHLLYYLWPTKHTDVWRWNVDQLLRRFPLFNGRRIICLALGADAETFETVRAPFANERVEWLLKANSSVGESAAWHMLWNRLAQDCSPDDFIFYAHGKGVKYPTPNEHVRIWTETMYRANLDHWPQVAELLKTHVTAGTFKTMLPGGRAFMNANSEWIYSGTFYWVRAREGLGCYKNLMHVYGGAELWPGQHFPASQGAEIFAPVPHHDSNNFPEIQRQFNAWEELTGETVPATPLPPSAVRVIPVCGKLGDAISQLPLVEQCGPCEVMLQHAHAGKGIAELFSALPAVQAVTYGADPHCGGWPWDYSFHESLQGYLARRLNVPLRLTCQTLQLPSVDDLGGPLDRILIHTNASEPGRRWDGWGAVQFPLPVMVSGGGIVRPEWDEWSGDFWETAKLMRRVRLVVEVNSSHLGLANALGVPHITVYTDPRHQTLWLSTGLSLPNPHPARVTTKIRDILAKCKSSSP
jgi:hypothetical protein